MQYYITSEQMLELAGAAKDLVANWTQKDRIIKTLVKVADQKLPSEDQGMRHLLGRWG